MVLYNPKSTNISTVAYSSCFIIFAHFPVGHRNSQTTNSLRLTALGYTIMFTFHSRLLFVLFSNRMALLNFMNVAKKNRPLMHLVYKPFLLQQQNKQLINSDHVPYLLLESRLKEAQLSVSPFQNGCTLGTPHFRSKCTTVLDLVCYVSLSHLSIIVVNNQRLSNSELSVSFSRLLLLYQHCPAPVIAFSGTQALLKHIEAEYEQQYSHSFWNTTGSCKLVNVY